MKEIWINLELYIERYEFSNFRDFYGFFLNLFSIFKLLKQLKNWKKGVYFCAGPTWMQCGTQGHVAKPRGPTRAPAWCGGDTCHAYLYLLII